MSGFKIIGLRTHALHKIKTSEQERAKRIYKVLKPGTDYLLNQGYLLCDTSCGLIKDAPSIDVYGMPGSDTHINISAIVGQNGSGKSSLIELMMRILNNFACYVLGEYRLHNAAEHLTFVDGIYATLYFAKNKDCYALAVEGRKVVLYKNGPDISQFAVALDSNSPIDLGIAKEWLLLDLFYTIINNYALHAYRTDDFEGENCSKTRLNEIFRINKPDTVELADQCWLKGIFHKNDGYKTPLVITPYRTNGSIDIGGEAYLNSQRLLSNFLFNEKGGYPFRQIDERLEARKLDVSLYPKEIYGFNNIIKRLDLKNTNSKLNAAHKEQFELIFDYWLEKLGLDKQRLKSNTTNRRLKNYIIFKTIKISRNYGSFITLYNRLKGQKATQKDITDHINEIIIRPSHITQKLRQALAYLKYKHLTPLNDSKISAKKQYNLNDLDRDISLIRNSLQNTLFEGVDSNGKQYAHQCTKWDLLPPPIFQAEILLFNRQEPAGNSIEYSTLSSGQRQGLYFTHSVLYHLSNINSGANDPYRTQICGTVCLIFEEVELYFHPEMQRKLIKNLIEAIHRTNLEKIKAIQMIFVTHSPFILSDIPKENCLFLEPDGRPTQKTEMKTFGANIFDILRHSFFLQDGVVGKFIQQRIQELVEKKQPDDNDYKVAELINDEVLKAYVLRKMDEKSSSTKRIARLEQEIKRLKGGKE